MSVRVIAIHGVGTPLEGVIGRKVEGLLATLECPLPVSEVYWNAVATHPTQDGRLMFGALEEVARRMARMSLIDSRRPPPPTKSDGFDRMRWASALKDAAYGVGELGMGLGFAVLVLLVPLLHLIGLVLGAQASLALGVGVWVVPSAFGALGTALVACTILVLFAMINAANERSMAPVWIALRRVAVLWLRPVVMTLAGPFLLPWRRLGRSFRELSRVWMPKIATTGIPLFCLLAWVVTWLASEPIGFVKTLGQAYGLLSAGVLIPLALAVLALFTAAVGGVFKVLLDVSRYIADPPYRAQIQALLDEAVERERREAGGRCSFVLIAHSLGSVIALDSLTSSDAWRTDDRVTLITLGSPLRRFFWRFFPGLLFASDARRCARRVASKLGGFRWLNCYRPWDQVGSSLMLTGEPFASELSTRQFRRVISAHLAYWNDPRVGSQVLAALAELPYSEAGPVPDPEPQQAMVGLESRLWVMKTFRILTLVGLLAGPFFGMAHCLGSGLCGEPATSGAAGWFALFAGTTIVPIFTLAAVWLVVLPWLEILVGVPRQRGTPSTSVVES